MSTRVSDKIEQARQRGKRVDRIYNRLDTVYMLVQDRALEAEIEDWMERADDAPASSLLDHVESTLSRFDTQHAMYRRTADGSGHFPDACKGCEHYGVACPLFTERGERLERERLQNDLATASEDEVKQQLRQLAGRVGCQVIVETVEEWEASYETLVSDGRELVERSKHILRDRAEASRAAEQTAAATDGGGR